MFLRVGRNVINLNQLLFIHIKPNDNDTISYRFVFPGEGNYIDHRSEDHNEIEAIAEKINYLLERNI